MAEEVMKDPVFISLLDNPKFQQLLQPEPDPESTP
jgi:hypothetical protein